MCGARVRGDGGRRDDGAIPEPLADRGAGSVCAGGGVTKERNGKHLLGMIAVQAGDGDRRRSVPERRETIFADRFRGKERAVESGFSIVVTSGIVTSGGGSGSVQFGRCR